MSDKHNGLLYGLQLLCVVFSVLALVSSVELKSIFGVALNSLSLGLNLGLILSHAMTDKLFSLLDESQAGWKRTLDAWAVDHAILTKKKTK